MENNNSNFHETISFQKALKGLRNNNTLQYYSKWKKVWYDLKRNLTESELTTMYSKSYIIRIKPKA